MLQRKLDRRKSNMLELAAETDAQSTAGGDKSEIAAVKLQQYCSRHARKGLQLDVPNLQQRNEGSQLAETQQIHGAEMASKKCNENKTGR